MIFSQIKPGRKIIASMDESHIPSAIDIEDDVQDWKLLTKMAGASIPKRGEKDELPDGTDFQTMQLQESKKAMYDAIDCSIRGHHLKQLLVCMWVPWEKRAIVLHAKGNYWKDAGKPIGKNLMILTPIECLYLVERGSMIAYLLEEQYRDEFTPQTYHTFDYSGCEAIDLAYLYALCFDSTGYTVDQYQIYSYLKRHGYLVRDFQDLDRNQRERLIEHEEKEKVARDEVNHVKSVQSFWSNFIHKSSLIVRALGILAYPATSALHFATKHYFSYYSVFRSLLLIKPYRKYDSLRISLNEGKERDERDGRDEREGRNEREGRDEREGRYESKGRDGEGRYESKERDEIKDKDNDLTLTFNVWKPLPSFSKKSPLVPDFQVCVTNTDKNKFPKLLQIQKLLNRINHEFPWEKNEEKTKVIKQRKEAPTGPSKKEIRMKKAMERHAKLDLKTQRRNTYLSKRDAIWRNGARTVVFALCNNGVINFINISEGTFAIENQELNDLIQRDHSIVWMEKSE